MKNLIAVIVACTAISGCTSFYPPMTKTVPVPASATTVGIPTSTESLEGYAALRRADFPAAERSLSNALAADPTDPYANLNMGWIMHQTSRPDSARKFYEAAIANGENTFTSTLLRAGDRTETLVNAAENKSIADYARYNLTQL